MATKAALVRERKAREAATKLARELAPVLAPKANEAWCHDYLRHAWLKGYDYARRLAKREAQS